MGGGIVIFFTFSLANPFELCYGLAHQKIPGPEPVGISRENPCGKIVTART